MKVVGLAPKILKSKCSNKKAFIMGGGDKLLVKTREKDLKAVFKRKANQ